MRPIVINGIDDLATRGDLLDRAIVLTLQRITESDRRTERDLQAAFDEARPQILGALLEGVSASLRNQDNVQLDTLPRMADFAVVAVAAAPALGIEADTFRAAYSENGRIADDLAIESSIIGNPVRELMAEHGSWEGTATKLLDELEQRVEEKDLKRRWWPASPRAMANELRRIATNLHAVGIVVQFDRVGRERRRVIHIRTTEQPEQAEILSSADDAPKLADSGRRRRSGPCGRKNPHPS